MDAYHFAWLDAHSHRTVEWLADMLRDGFDVHHLDGNHGNDDPSNLVLIEHTDHMRLHGMTRCSGRLASLRAKPKPRKVRGRSKRISLELGGAKANSARAAKAYAEVASTSD
jgi:hypothetical protein